MTSRILPAGTPSLREVASAVTDVHAPALLNEAVELSDALRAFRAEHGFGRAIAAPQIGIGKRMIGLALPGWPAVIVNPEIVWKSDERMTLWDDCMCFPDMLVRVERYASVSVRFMHLDGTSEVKASLSRAESELMQHEIDHLDGKLSFDRAVGANPFVRRSVFEVERTSFAKLVDYFPQDAWESPMPIQDIGRIDGLVYPTGVAYMSGNFMPMSEARISVLDWGLLHSDVTYDTVHVWNGKFFRLDLHLARFRRSLSKLRLNVTLTDDQICHILVECVRRSGLRDAYVEMLCTRGISPTFSRDPREAINQFVAFAVPFGSVANERQLKEGLHLHLIDDVRRIPPESVDPQIKNYHWLDLVTALFKGYDAGAETVVIRDTGGHIAEGPGFNIFIAKGGELYTPDLGVLHGITRQTVFDLAASMNLPVHACDMSEAQLRDADEIFITSTAGGIMPVTTLNGVSIGNGKPGRFTRELYDAYWLKHDDPAWTLTVVYDSSAQT
jgi:branched-chain amino acid aminotransferase